MKGDDNVNKKKKGKTLHQKLKKKSKKQKVAI